jgi:DNA-directed RNA polymerase specialized sigma subunit
MAIFGNNRETYTAFIKSQLSLIEETPLKDPLAISCEKDCIKCVEEGKSRLGELLEAYNLTYEDMLRDKKRRNELIVHFRKASVLSLKEIGSLFGGISESAISKIIKRYLTDKA